MKRPFYTTLYFRVLVGIALGVGLGIAIPDVGARCKPLGDAFIDLIKMTIAPLIFCTVVVGITGMRSKAQVGKAGGLAILYFEVASTLALLIGLVIVNVAQPGAGFHADPAAIDPSVADKLLAGAHHKTTVEFLLGIIPETFFGALARGELLPVLLRRHAVRVRAARARRPRPADRRARRWHRPRDLRRDRDRDAGRADRRVRRDRVHGRRSSASARSARSRS